MAFNDKKLKGEEIETIIPRSFFERNGKEGKKVLINPKAEVTPKPNVSNLAEKRKKKHFALISIDRGLLLKKEGASEN